MLERFNSISENRRNLSELDAIKVAQILEASPNEVYLFNQTTLQIEYANLRATKNLSYSLEQLQTMTVLDVETEFNRADFKRLVRENSSSF
jgi:nitrogen-specific signal transduction histidine kinase